MKRESLPLCTNSKTCFIFSVKVGDGTNFVLILAGALLNQAEDLLRMGLSSSEVIEGYQMAANKALNFLPSERIIHSENYVKCLGSKFNF